MQCAIYGLRALNPIPYTLEGRDDLGTCVNEGLFVGKWCLRFMCRHQPRAKHYAICSQHQCRCRLVMRMQTSVLVAMYAACKLLHSRCVMAECEKCGELAYLRCRMPAAVQV